MSIVFSINSISPDLDDFEIPQGVYDINLFNLDFVAVPNDLSRFIAIDIV